MRKNALAGWLLLAPALALLGGLVLFPIIYNAWLSLHDKHAFLTVQTFVGLRHYVYFAHDEEFWNSFYYGVVYAGSTMALQLVLGIPAALLLNEAFRGRNLLRGVVLFPYVIPTIVAVMLWKWLLNDSYGLVNHLLVTTGVVRVPLAWLGKDYIMWSLVLTSVWQFFPFVVVTYLARLQIVLLRSTWMFTKFDTVWLMAGEGGVSRYIRTLPVYAYARSFTYLQAGMGAALAVIMFVLLLVATAVYFRVFRQEEALA